MPHDALDPQKNRLYQAQAAVFRLEKTDWTLGELQAFANEILAAPWWRSRYPRVRTFAVKDGRGSDTSRLGRDGSGQMMRGERRRHLVLHEMAHRIDPTGTEDHGGVFAALFLFLVGHVYSRNKKRTLAREFREHEVVWDSKIARTGRP